MIYNGAAQYLYVHCKKMYCKYVPSVRAHLNNYPYIKRKLSSVKTFREWRPLRLLGHVTLRKWRHNGYRHLRHRSISRLLPRGAGHQLFKRARANTAHYHPPFGHTHVIYHRVCETIDQNGLSRSTTYAYKEHAWAVEEECNICRGKQRKIPDLYYIYI